MAAMQKTHISQEFRIRIPQPDFTEWTYLSVVPVFDHGEPPGGPKGSPGEYEVVFALGIPGVSTATTDVDSARLIASGDSLLAVQPFQIELTKPDGSIGMTWIAEVNGHGRLAALRTTLRAASLHDAEREAHDAVMPVLSRLAFESDSAVDIKATIVRESSSGTQTIATYLLGRPRTPSALKGTMTEELRPFLAAYREGLNSTAPMYAALCFSRVVEGVGTFHKRREREAKKTGATAPSDPMQLRIPDKVEDIRYVGPWSRDFTCPTSDRHFAACMRVSPTRFGMRLPISHPEETFALRINSPTSSSAERPFHCFG